MQGSVVDMIQSASSSSTSALFRSDTTVACASDNVRDVPLRRRPDSGHHTKALLVLPNDDVPHGEPLAQSETADTSSESSMSASASWSWNGANTAAPRDASVVVVPIIAPISRVDIVQTEQPTCERDSSQSRSAWSIARHQQQQHSTRAVASSSSSSSSQPSPGTTPRSPTTAVATTPVSCYMLPTGQVADAKNTMQSFSVLAVVPGRAPTTREPDSAEGIEAHTHHCLVHAQVWNPGHDAMVTHNGNLTAMTSTTLDSSSDSGFYKATMDDASYGWPRAIAVAAAPLVVADPVVGCHNQHSWDQQHRVPVEHPSPLVGSSRRCHRDSGLLLLRITAGCVQQPRSSRRIWCGGRMVRAVVVVVLVTDNATRLGLAIARF
jgi:hypothetical protein